MGHHQRLSVRAKHAVLIVVAAAMLVATAATPASAGSDQWNGTIPPGESAQA